MEGSSTVSRPGDQDAPAAADPLLERGNDEAAVGGQIDISLRMARPGERAVARQRGA
jgi:hypothetical protein